MREAARLSPELPARVAFDRARRRRETGRARRLASSLLRDVPAAPEPALRVTVVSPEPTPYRAPLFDRLARRPDLELTVVYAARTVAGRTWSVQPSHRSVFLRGVAVPGLRRMFRHDYPVTPGIRRALRAILWCRAAGVPYVLLVESHELDPRSAWRRLLKGAVVPRLVRGAASVLVVGTLARDAVVARGADPDRVRIFANTIDVAAWEERAERLGRKRRKLRAELAVGDDDMLVVSVGRLAPEKGFDTLLRGVAEAGGPRFVVVIFPPPFRSM